jgi:hypothetical protein
MCRRDASGGKAMRRRMHARAVSSARPEPAIQVSGTPRFGRTPDPRAPTAVPRPSSTQPMIRRRWSSVSATGPSSMPPGGGQRLRSRACELADMFPLWSFPPGLAVQCPDLIGAGPTPSQHLHTSGQSKAPPGVCHRRASSTVHISSLTDQLLDDEVLAVMTITFAPYRFDHA